MTSPHHQRRFPKLEIRQGLPQYLPKEALKLIKCGLLHDFVNCSIHKSKIYVEPELENLETLRKHHDKTNDPFIQKFQRYDRLASIITRKIRSPRQTRYNWKSTKTIDFEQLAKEIAEVAKTSVRKLYQYIYESKAFG